jgi:2-aminobenzoate-CoA ligase
MASEPGYTAHRDTFARDNLPPRATWPELDLTLCPDNVLDYPDRLNCVSALLDERIEAGEGSRVALRFEGRTTTYAELQRLVNRIAHVLVDDFSVVPGNRVLLRGPNNPLMVACWLAVLKAGAIAVTTMPLLRARELRSTIAKARVSLALCDGRFADDLRAALVDAPSPGLAPPALCLFNAEADAASLEARAAHKSERFDAVPTAVDDVALIAFTSGSTGQGKGTMHFHRDVLAICDCFSRCILQPGPDDIFCGTPPLAFTFALGCLLLFPFRVGASVVLIEQPSPPALLEAIQSERVTIVATAPTMYRTLAPLVAGRDVGSLRKCISAGEPLPLTTFRAWEDATGLRLIDGIGATEMLHIFISAAGDAIRPGSTGRPVPGYEAKVVDDAGNEVAPGTIGRLAVRGATGCRYLADPVRQREYVRDGWNLTGDAYLTDADGYFWFQARADDMILSSGYNIAGPEIENVLLDHPKVRECAVIGIPDAARGNIVAAYVVLRDPADANDATIAELQAHVRAEIAPYKYPRRVEFVEALPRTETGKVQRFRLRESVAGS